MGFYIRKALKVGPLRFNLSKSGVGVSAGVKGLRLGTGPRGNYVHMGRAGLYFRKSLNAPSSAGPTPQPAPHQAPPSPSDSVGPMEDIESVSVVQMVDGTSRELLEELNDKRRKVRYAPIAAAGSVLTVFVMIGNNAPGWLMAAFGAVAAGLWWMASAKDALRKTTVILYDLEPDVESAYQQLHDGFAQLQSSARAWHIEARGDVRDAKYHAGAGEVVKRKPISLQRGAPPFVKSNVEIPLIPVGKQTLALMPDRLLVFEPAGVGAVGYKDLSLAQTDSKFIEDESVPKDATVVGKTWRYVNKKGGPDKRFKDNRELPICAYDEVRFSSPQGLNELIQLSCRGSGAALSAATQQLAKFAGGGNRASAD